MAFKIVNGIKYKWSNGNPLSVPPQPEGWVPVGRVSGGAGNRPMPTRPNNARNFGIDAETAGTDADSMFGFPGGGNLIIDQPEANFSGGGKLLVEQNFSGGGKLRIVNPKTAPAEFDLNAEGDEYEEEQTVYPAEGSPILYVSPRVQDGKVTDMNKIEVRIKNGVFTDGDIVMLNHPGYAADYYVVNGVWDAKDGGGTAFIDIPYDDSTGERNVEPYSENPIDHTEGTIEIVGSVNDYLEEELSADGDDDFNMDEHGYTGKDSTRNRKTRSADGDDDIDQGEDDDQYNEFADNADSTADIEQFVNADEDDADDQGEEDGDEEYENAEGIEYALKSKSSFNPYAAKKRKRRVEIRQRIKAIKKTLASSKFAPGGAKPLWAELSSLQMELDALKQKQGKVLVTTGGLSGVFKSKENKGGKKGKLFTFKGKKKKGKFLSRTGALKRKAKAAAGRKQGLKGKALRKFIRKG